MDTEELALAISSAVSKKPAAAGVNPVVGTDRRSRMDEPQVNFRDKESVQKLIRKLLEAGFTRADIAKSCDVNRLTICAWEVGEMSPNKKHAQILETLSKVF